MTIVRLNYEGLLALFRAAIGGVVNCPHCGFKFEVLAANGDITGAGAAPLICESCLKISILEPKVGTAVGFTLRQATAEELVAIEQSPAWRDVIKPVRDALMARRN